MWTGSLTRPVSCAVCLSRGCSVGALGLLVWTSTPPHSGGRTPRPGPVRVCVCVLFSVGSCRGTSRACALARLTCSCDRSPCSLYLLGPLLAGIPMFMLVAVCFCLCFLCAPGVSRVVSFPAQAALGLCVLSSPPPPVFVSCALVVSGLLWLLALAAVDLYSPPPLWSFFAPSPVFVSCFPLLYFFCCCFIVFLCSAVLRRALSCWLCSAAVVSVSWAVQCVGACCCAVTCVLSCGTAVCGVACFAFCLLSGLLVSGYGSCAVLSGAVLCWVLLCWFCCALLLRAVLFSAVFLGVVPCLFVLLRRVAVYVVLCRGASWCLAWLCRVALFRWLLVRCVVVCLMVLCCVVCFVALLVSRLALYAAVAGSYALSLDAVLCSPAVLPVVWVLSFFLPCFLAARVSWRLLCGAVLACLRLRFVRRAPLPLWCWLVPCVAACFIWLFAVGSGCLLLSPGGSSWRVLALLSLYGRVTCWPVVWCCVSWWSAPRVVSCGAVVLCGGVLWCSAVCVWCCPCLLLLSSF